MREIGGSEDTGDTGDPTVTAVLPEPGPATPSTGPAAPSLRRLVGAGAAVGLGCAAIALVDPTDSGVPLCWSQSVFGVDCPLCGGLRCVNSLARGDVAAAADHNVLLAVALPAVALVWLVQVGLATRGRPLRMPTVPRWLWVALAVLAVAFTVTRNLDADGFVGWLAATRT